METGLLFMTKQIVQEIKISKSLHNINSRNLSIQFSLDGFSFCIYSQEQKVTDLVSYAFEKKVDNPMELLQEIERIFVAEKLLQQDFKSVLVIHQNELSSFVPDNYFDENKLADYLKYNIKVLQTDFIAFDTIDKISAKNVYIPYVNINNYLFQNFGAFEYKHHLTILIDKLMRENSTEKKCYVNVCKSTFDVMLIENGNLLFSNTFKYQTEQDFIYYLLFVAEQLKLDLETILVVLIGEIDSKSDLYKIAFTYIRNINFISNNSSFFDDEKQLLQHQNYTLIN
jgi:hypothetical protein